jgi:hypothetical protein
MQIGGSVKKLSVYMSERESYEGQPLYRALLEQARKAGCAGATVLRGIEGFGATSVQQGEFVMRMSEDLPVLIHVIDSEPRVTALSAVFSAMVGDGLITIEDVDVLLYRGGTTP